MSGEFIYENYGQPEDFQLKKTSSRKMEKGLKKILVIAAIILGAEFVWLFGVSPCIPFSVVNVKGFPGFEKDAILRFAGIGESASFVSLNAAAVEKKLEGHYLVESARVTKRFPDRLSISLEPRKAVTLSLVTITDGQMSRQIPVYIDKSGVVFQIGNGNDVPRNAPRVNLPVLSGIVIEQPSLGMRLPTAFVPLLEEFARLGNDAPHLMAAVSEIQVNRKPYDGFDLTLFPVHSPVRVQLGSNLSEETIRYALLVLDVLKQQNSQPGEIAFRSGISSYTVKEAPFVE